MEEKQEVRKVRRIFTPEQKFEILKISSVIRRSKKDGQASAGSIVVAQVEATQLEVGVRASLRNSRPLKSTELKRLEAENRKLRVALLPLWREVNFTFIWEALRREFFDTGAYMQAFVPDDFVP